MYIVVSCLLLLIIGLIAGSILVKRTELWRLVGRSSLEERWEMFAETRRRLKGK
jgi:hypothetical protein